MKRTRVLLLLDMVLFLSLVLLFEPRFSGLAVHEWLGMAVSMPVLIHILLSWRWIVTTLARLKATANWRLRVNAFLNMLLFIAFIVTAFSGIMTSFVALPALGIPPGHFEGWLQLHNRWEERLEVLAGLHVAMNWRWIARAVGNLLPRRRADHEAVAVVMDAWG